VTQGQLTGIGINTHLPIIVFAAAGTMLSMRLQTKPEASLPFTGTTSRKSF
jgi:hypothetical protein